MKYHTMFRFQITTVFINSLILLVLSRHAERSIPECPKADEISPCVCVLNNQMQLRMDCSAVADEDELSSAFNNHFSFSDFYSLEIKHNQNIRVLRKDVFRDVTFQEIYIKYNALEEVQAGALTGSVLTVTKLDFQHNRLSAFPFQEMQKFEQLKDLYVANNTFTIFPEIESKTVEKLHLAMNPITAIPYGSLRGLPSLCFLWLYSCRIAEIEQGTFTGLQNLSYLSLANNQLTGILPHTFQIHGKVSRLFLNYNTISIVAKDSFTGVHDYMQMEGNNLQVLEEIVWKPMLDVGVKLVLKDNPFACGCDIAWLVRNTTLMSQIYEGATCADGTEFSELDPADYELCSLQ